MFFYLIFSLEKHYYRLSTHLLVERSSLKLKHLNDGFVSYKHASFHFCYAVLLVNYCDVFISCLDSHSDGTHSLQIEDILVNKWFNARFLQIWWRNKFIYFLDGMIVSTFSANFNFWLNYSFKEHLNNIKNLCHFKKPLEWKVLWILKVLHGAIKALRSAELVQLEAFAFIDLKYVSGFRCAVI